MNHVNQARDRWNIAYHCYSLKFDILPIPKYIEKNTHYVRFSTGLKLRNLELCVLILNYQSYTYCSNICKSKIELKEARDQIQTALKLELTFEYCGNFTLTSVPLDNSLENSMFPL